MPWFLIESLDRANASATTLTGSLNEATGSANEAVGAVKSLGNFLIGALPKAGGATHTTDVLADEGVDDTGGDPAAAAAAPAFSLQQLHFKVQQLPGLVKKAADEAANTLNQTNAAIDATSEKLTAFEKQLAAIMAAPGLTFGDKNGSGSAFSGPELLAQLEKLVRQQQNARGAIDARTQIALEDSIQKIVRLIQVWTGGAGSTFSLAQFRDWVKAHQPPTGSGVGAPATSIETFLSTGR